MEELSYEKAYQELQSILTELKAHKIPLEKLQGKILRAKELLEYCKDNLRETSKSVQSLLEEE